MKSTFIIAEIGQAHDGSLGILHSYIDAVAGTGVDAVKFQTHIAEAESSAHEPFRVKFSYEDKTRYDYWKRMEFTPDQWQGIKAHCEDKGLEFISSPFSNAAVDLLERLGVKRYKIGSGEVSNYLMLEKAARTGKPIILSSGMSSYSELDHAVDFLAPFTPDLAILQCTTQYPTGPADVGLNVISELKERYQVPIGLSDHSGTIFPALSAVTLGAEIIECHIIFDRQMFGPDTTSSLTIQEVSQLVQGIRFIDQMTACAIDKNNTDRFKQVKAIFEKSLAVNKSLPAGHCLTFDDLEGKKPAGCGMDAREYNTIIGKSLKKPIDKWEFITKDHIHD